MVTTLFENEYVEVLNRKQADYIVKNFVKTCDCNWENNENCNKCCSIENLKHHLEDNPNCLIFVRYKYKTPEGREEWRWSTRRYVSSISEYIEEELESDIELVKSEMGGK